MVKYTENVLMYTNTIIFLVKRLTIIAKCCLNWIFIFHDALYYCARYVNIEYQNDIFKTYHQKYRSKGNG